MNQKEYKEQLEKRMVEVYKGDQERNRWFCSEKKLEDYSTTRLAIQKSLLGEEFNTCLEIGCGPGTFTKAVLDMNPNTDITAVDLSPEMIRQAKINLSGKDINFVTGDFLKFESSEKYDLVFSSRAIEYIADKNVLVGMIDRYLKPGGLGIIVTKQPHPIHTWFWGLTHKINPEHLMRIGENELRKLLENRGFTDITIKPVIKRGLMFNESYIIKFRK